MQNIEEVLLRKHCKERHLLLPNFLLMFLINFQKKSKIANNNENPKKCIFDIFASFLTFSTLSQKNLHFKGLLNVFDF